MDLNQDQPVLQVELSAANDRFCLEYAYSNNGVRSYLKAHPGAGYNTANTEAARLLKRPEIKARINQLRKERRKKLERNADKLLGRLEARAAINPRDFFDDTGKPIPLHELEPDMCLGIKSIKTRRVIEGKGDDKVTVEFVEYQFFEGRASDELIGKNLKLWNDVGSKENPLVQQERLVVVFGDED